MCPNCNRQPNLATRVSSLTKSATGWAAKGFPFTPKEQYYERLAICKQCPSLDANGFGGTGKCSECGCSIYAKPRLATEKCPLGKW